MQMKRLSHHESVIPFCGVFENGESLIHFKASTSDNYVNNRLAQLAYNLYFAASLCSHCK